MNMDIKFLLAPIMETIIAVVPYAGKVKAGGGRKDASTFPKTTIYSVTIADGHPNPTNGSRKCRDCRSIRWWMRLRRVIMG
jgi:hypothetical protein